MFEVIKNDNKPLTARLADQIVRLIIDNRFRAGDKLPNEYELAKMLNVGRSTVREAIKILVSANILEIRRGAGTFVSEKPGVADDPLGLKFIKDKAKLSLDLLEIRLMIEPQIAARAAAKATSDDIRQLNQLCREVEDLIQSGQNHLHKDIQLHTKIAESIDNLVIPNLIPIINTAIAVFIDVTHNELRQETIDTHRQIIRAIEAREPQKAHDAMVKHLIHNLDTIQKILPAH